MPSPPARTSARRFMVSPGCDARSQTDRCYCAESATRCRYDPKDAVAFHRQLVVSLRIDAPGSPCGYGISSRRSRRPHERRRLTKRPAGSMQRNPCRPHRSAAARDSRRARARLQTPKTMAKVRAALAGLPLEWKTGKSTTEPCGVMRGGRREDGAAWRGYMDALPMPEDTDLPSSPRLAGTMHACGHDTPHGDARLGCAAALRAARIARRDRPLCSSRAKKAGSAPS